jgi:TetR/AcrR family transcriptional regulator
MRTRQVVKYLKKEKLLKVATRLFAEKGYKGVTIREISKTSNASISMIAYYFGGKEALYEAVLRQQFSCYDWLDDLDDVESNPLIRIKNYIIWSLTKHRDNEYFSKLYIRELINPTKYHSTFIKPLLSKSYKYLNDVIADGKSKGVVESNIDSNAIAMSIVTTVNYAGFYDGIDSEITNFNKIEVAYMADMYMNILVNGISVDASDVTKLKG